MEINPREIFAQNKTNIFAETYLHFKNGEIFIFSLCKEKTKIGVECELPWPSLYTGTVGTYRTGTDMVVCTVLHIAYSVGTGTYFIEDPYQIETMPILNFHFDV